MALKKIGSKFHKKRTKSDQFEPIIVFFSVLLTRLQDYSMTKTGIFVKSNAEPDKRIQY